VDDTGFANRLIAKEDNLVFILSRVAVSVIHL
jgi:hypothetical protein